MSLLNLLRVKYYVCRSGLVEVNGRSLIRKHADLMAKQWIVLWVAECTRDTKKTYREFFHLLYPISAQIVYNNSCMKLRCPVIHSTANVKRKTIDIESCIGLWQCLRYWRQAFPAYDHRTCCLHGTRFLRGHSLCTFTAIQTYALNVNIRTSAFLYST